MSKKPAQINKKKVVSSEVKEFHGPSSNTVSRVSFNQEGRTFYLKRTQALQPDGTVVVHELVELLK